MKPYVITELRLITYDGKEIPVELIEREILTEPPRLVKERILDAFKTMKDTPVEVKMKIKLV
jgi:hypothetical protein|nr:MAG TPA: hypothetical protein [Caudoviricetes sp.]